MAHWREVREAVDGGRYRPSSVRRVGIPKPEGGERQLGIATVLDRRVLKPIRAYLESGVMVKGVVIDIGEGTPQGGPLSAQLSKIMLDDLDKELEKRGHKIVR